MQATVVVSGELFEVINGALFFAVAFILFKVFGPFLIGVWLEKRDYKYRWHAFHREAGPALALVVLILGDAIVRGPVWLQRWAANHHRPDWSIDPTVFLLIVIAGVLVALLGTWCVARVYGTARDGLLAVLISVGAAIALAYPWN